MSDSSSQNPQAAVQAGTVVEEALEHLWQVANRLSAIEPPAHDNYRVTVFGSARVKPGQPLYEDVKGLATECAKRGCDIVTGGGPGLMQAANEGAQIGDPEDKVRSIGVRIELPFEQGANEYVEDCFTHQTFFTRLHHFMRLSNAFVVVGGGIGTTLETLLVWQLLQVSHAEDVPLILVGPMWAELVEWAKKHMLAHDPQLASPEDMNIPVCVPTLEAALDHLEPHIAAFQATRAKARS